MDHTPYCCAGCRTTFHTDQLCSRSAAKNLTQPYRFVCERVNQ